MSDKLLDKAKIGILIKKAIFLSTIIFSLRNHWDTSLPTAGTDGMNLVINPDWFASLTPAQRIGLLAHEAYHVVFQHMFRDAKLDKLRWNIAGDHLINLLLLENGFEIPPGGHADKKYKNMSTMQIYLDLPEEVKTGSAAIDGYDPDVIYVDKDDKKINMAITDTIIKAMTRSKMEGEEPSAIPGEANRLIQELINPVLPWRSLLSRFLAEKVKEDYSWQRPNRRFFPDYHLPSQYSDSLDNIAVAVDTSGSVTDKQFIEFLSEINYIHTNMNPKLITVIDFDTSIKAVHELKPGDRVTDIKFEGYGGTNIRPVLDWAIENQPTVMIIFTDGGFRKYEPDIKFPLMWIIYDNPKFKSKLGQVVIYD